MKEIPQYIWEDDSKIHLTKIRNQLGECGLDSSGLGQWPVAESYDHNNERSGSTNRSQFLDYVNDC
jgi:hypothetical protein